LDVSEDPAVPIITGLPSVSEWSVHIDEHMPSHNKAQHSFGVVAMRASFFIY